MLPTWLNYMWHGNSLRGWLLALGGALLAASAVALLRRYLIRYLEVAAARTDTVADDYVVDLLKGIRTPLVFAVTIAIAERFLVLSDRVDHAATSLMIIAFALQGLRWASGTVDFWVAHYTERTNTHVEKSAIGVLKFVARLILWMTVIALAAEALGKDLRTIFGFLSVGGIAIALAVQNVLGDLFAALSIWLDKPFVGGDTIAVDSFEGTVEHIGLKTTRIRSVNGEELVFSNADLLRSRIRNFSRREGRRIVFMLSIAPGTSAAKLAQVPELIREAIAAQTAATLMRTHLNGVGPLGFEVETAMLVTDPDYAHAMEVRQSVLLGIFERLEREGITLARPVAAAAAAVGVA